MIQTAKEKEERKNCWALVKIAFHGYNKQTKKQIHSVTDETDKHLAKSECTQIYFDQIEL